MCIKFFKRKPIDEETDDFDHIRHELPGLPSAAPSRRLTRRKTAKTTTSQMPKASRINRTDRLTSIFRKTPIENEQRPSGRWSQISNRPSYLSTAELDDNLSDDFISSTLSNCKPGLRDSQAQQLFE